MEFGVLGPLEVTDGRADMTPTAPKPRQLLALMAVHAGRILPVPTLIRELWDEDPPRSAQTTLQTYVLQLRKLFATGLNVSTETVSTELLVTKVGGYQLHVEPDMVDLFRFERLSRAGRAAQSCNDFESAASLLRQALQLWRDHPLVDVPRGPLLQAQAVAMEEARLAAQEACLEAELRLGRHEEVLAELAYLVACHPLHEGLHAQLLRVLHRSGRRCQALETFRRLRTRLVDEFGIEPSDELQQLQRAILTSDPVLDLSTRARGHL